MLIPSLVVSVDRAPQSFTRLSEALAAASWNAAQRGPLLIVSQKEVPRATPPVLFSPFGVPEAARAFDQQVVFCGSVSVVAPLYQPPARPSTPVASGNPLLTLLDLLSDSQLKRVGSAQGLGLADLTSPEQQDAFQRLVPEPMAYRKALASGSGYSSSGESIPLSAGERTQVRLRILQRSQLSLLATAQGGRMRQARDLGSQPYGTPFLALAEREDFPRRAETPLRVGLPNRLKPSELAFDAPALQHAVPLDGIHTVGALVEACGASAPLELHADLTYRALPVQLRTAPGATARTGDLLKALCWSLQATFRRVGSAYVLTPDPEGLGAQAARAEIAARDRELKRYEQQDGQRKRLRERPLSSVFPFAGDDPLARDASLRQQVQQGAPRKEGALSYPGLVVPLNQAPSALRQQALTSLAEEEKHNAEARRRMAEAASRIAARGGNFKEPPTEEPFVPDLLQLRTRFEPELVLPSGEGVLLYQRVTELSALLLEAAVGGIGKPVAYTVPFVLTGKPAQESAVLAAPKTAAEAMTLVESVAQQGLVNVWIEVDSDFTALDAALVAGKARGVRIGAALKLLKSGAPSLSPETYDRTVLGEDGLAWLKRGREGFLWQGLYQDLPPTPWLSPAAPSAKAHLLARLSALAMRPPLQRVICVDTMPPGYNNEPRAPFGLVAREAGEFGYTVENRLSFLRQNHRDPIDLSPPFSPLHESWNTERRALRDTFLQDTYRLLHERLPGVSVLFNGTPLEWFGSWESAERVPERKTRAVAFDPVDRTGPSQVAHKTSMLALKSVRYRPGALSKPRMEGMRPSPILPDGPAALAYTLAEALAEDALQGTKPPDWEGYVLDLRQVPPAQIPALLKGITVQKR